MPSRPEGGNQGAPRTFLVSSQLDLERPAPGSWTQIRSGRQKVTWRFLCRAVTANLEYPGGGPVVNVLLHLAPAVQALFGLPKCREHPARPHGRWQHVIR
jgi:hypothetical protein